MGASDEHPEPILVNDSCHDLVEKEEQGTTISLPLSIAALQALDLDQQSPQLQEPRTASTTYHTASPGVLPSGPALSLPAMSSSEAESRSSSGEFCVAQSTLGRARCHLQVLSGE